MQRTEKMQEAKRLYQKGERLVDIAKKLNVPDGTVRRWKHVQNWDERSDNPYKEWQKKKEEEKIVKEVRTISENSNLTDKQKLFCVYYVKSFNATKSYQKAYGCSYESACGNSGKLIKNPNIKAEIERLKQNRLNREWLTEDDIFQKYMDIAFADVTEYMTFGSEKGRDEETGEEVTRNYLTFNDSTKIDGTLITEISNVKGEARIKLADRMKALQWLSDHLNIATEEQKARLAVMRAKLDTEDDEETADDGFIDALNASAGEDWEDEKED